MYVQYYYLHRYIDQHTTGSPSPLTRPTAEDIHYNLHKSFMNRRETIHEEYAIRV